MGTLFGIRVVHRCDLPGISRMCGRMNRAGLRYRVDPTLTLKWRTSLEGGGQVVSWRRSRSRIVTFSDALPVVKGFTL
jgi:hypothetical protein